MTTVNEDLRAIAAALSNLAKDLGQIGRKAAKLESSPPAEGRRKAAAKTTTAKKTAKSDSKPQVASERTGKAGEASVLDRVFDAVRRSHSGATIAKLREKTGLEARQLSNALYKLSKRGKIESPSRGVYIKK